MFFAHHAIAISKCCYNMPQLEGFSQLCFLNPLLPLSYLEKDTIVYFCNENKTLAKLAPMKLFASDLKSTISYSRRTFFLAISNSNLIHLSVG